MLQNCNIGRIPRIHLSYSNGSADRERREGWRKKGGESDLAAATTRVVIRKGSLKVLEPPVLQAPYRRAQHGGVRERERKRCVWEVLRLPQHPVVMIS